MGILEILLNKGKKAVSFRDLLVVILPAPIGQDLFRIFQFDAIRCSCLLFYDFGLIPEVFVDNSISFRVSDPLFSCFEDPLTVRLVR